MRNSKTLSHDLDHHDRHGHRDRVLSLRAKLRRVLARIVVSSATSWPGVELEERHAETIAERSPSRRSDPGGQNFRPGDYADYPRKIFCNPEKLTRI